jgi:hypothetical protein
MPEKGWIALTVRESVGSRIKELARKDGLTVSEYLERVVSGRNAIESAVQGPKNATEECTACGLCKVQLKTRNLPEHMSRLHKKLWRSGATQAGGVS